MLRLKIALSGVVALVLVASSKAQDPTAYPPPPPPPPPVAVPGGLPDEVPTLPPPAAPVEPLKQPSWLVQDPGALTADGYASNQFGNQNTPLPPGKSVLIPGCNTNPGPTYIVTVDAQLWRMEHGRSVPVVVDQAGNIIRTTDDVDLGLSAGPRVNMAYVTEEGNSFEVNYFGFYNWSGTTVDTTLTPDLRLPDTFGTLPFSLDYFASDQFKVDYNARINSFELNLVFARDPSRTFQVILGPRYLRLDEQLIITSYPPFIPPGISTPGIPPRYQSSYEVDTQNELFGVQVGGAWHRCRGRWDWVTTLKTGVYNNNGKQSTFVTDLDRTIVDRSGTVRQDVAAFVGDFNVSANYCLGGHWFLRGGYSALWMQGVARASDQLNFAGYPGAGTDRIFFREAMVAHGINLGFEGRW